MDKTALLDAMGTWSEEDRHDFLTEALDRYGDVIPDPDPNLWAEIERRRAEHLADPSSSITRQEFESRRRAAR